MRFLRFLPKSGYFLHPSGAGGLRFGAKQVTIQTENRFALWNATKKRGCSCGKQQRRRAERVGGKQKKLCARIADNGQDSLLKQVVVSYGKVKSPGSIVDLMIEWCWPNMLNVTDCDYTTLPNFLAGTVKHLKMSLECKEDIGFKSASIYKYKVGMDKAQLILDVDMSEITDTISYEEDNPLMNSTYILYYEVAR